MTYLLNILLTLQLCPLCLNTAQIAYCHSFNANVNFIYRSDVPEDAHS